MRDTFAVATVFTASGIQVTLGQSGTIGQVAVANGLAAAYSVGVGMLEHLNHKTVVNRQSKEPKPRTEDDPGGGRSPASTCPASQPRSPTGPRAHSST